MQRVNQVIDVKNPAAEIQNLQHECEQRNTTQHHVGQVAEERTNKKLQFRSAFAELFFGMPLQPLLERRGRARVWIERDEWLSTLFGLRRDLCGLGGCGRRCRRRFA